MNSSLSNQSSFQNKEISFFTRSFINSLKEHKSAEIRYKDIVDVIIDEFSNISEQTPFFVVQADFTEKFCTLNSDVRTFLDRLNFKNATLPSEEPKTISIIELVKQDAKEYADKEGAIQALHFIYDDFNSLKLEGELGELFDVHITTVENYESVFKKNIIAKWLNENGKEYFVTTLYDTYYDEEDGSEREYVSGFQLKLDVPFKGIAIDISAKYPNLTNYYCNALFFLSKKNVRIFHFITNYVETSWDHKFVNGSEVKWVTGEYKITDRESLIDGVNKVKEKISFKLKQDIETKFGLNSPKDVDENRQEKKE